MSWRAAQIQLQAVKVTEQAHHITVLFPVPAVVSPAGNGDGCFRLHILQPAPVEPPDRMHCFQQIFRPGCTVGKQVAYQESVITPALSKSDAASYGRIIVSLVCSGGIQSDKQRTITAWLPVTPKGITISAIA